MSHHCHQETRKPCGCDCQRAQCGCDCDCDCRNVDDFEDGDEDRPSRGFSSSSFGNTVSLQSGVFQYLGINDLVSGPPAGTLDARLLNERQRITRLKATLGSVLAPGVTLIVSLYVSTDDGVSFSPVAAAIIPPGFRTNSTTFDLELPANSLHCIGLLTAGGAYSGPVSITVS